MYTRGFHKVHKKQAFSLAVPMLPSRLEVCNLILCSGSWTEHSANADLGRQQCRLKALGSCHPQDKPGWCSQPIVSALLSSSYFRYEGWELYFSKSKKFKKVKTTYSELCIDLLFFCIKNLHFSWNFWNVLLILLYTNYIQRITADLW